VICFLSTVSLAMVQMIQEIRALSQCRELILLTTFSQEILDTFEDFHLLTQSPDTRTVYLPLHTIHILHPKQQKVILHTLSLCPSLLSLSLSLYLSLTSLLLLSLSLSLGRVVFFVFAFVSESLPSSLASFGRSRWQYSDHPKQKNL
jgi:hypothetical protein